MKPLNLKDLTPLLESYNRLDERLRLSIFGGLLLAVFFLDVYFLGLPQWAAINDIHDQIRTLSSDMSQVLNDKHRISQLKENLQKARLKYTAANGRLRGLQEVPNILASISRAAYDQEVKIDKLMPLKNQQQSLKATLPGHFYALPIVVVVHSGYHRFGRFLNKLENGDFYFILRDMTVQNDEKFPNARLFSLTINVILKDIT